jgi:HK97 family phage portal protein
MEARNITVLAYSAVYSCVTLIATDVSKMCLRLVQEDADGIWNKTESAAFSPVLRKPNHFQNRIKFIENWVVSKLTRGNTIVLKQRDERGVVIALYILDWARCKPLVAENGDVFYQLYRDDLAGIPQEGITVPATEIIHDVNVPLFHPLCGVSAIFASGYAAMQALAIQGNSTKFFSNGAQPGGVLSAPGTIDDITAKRLKEHWEQNYSGANAGRVAVLGDGLKFERMVMTSVESQMIEQLKWTGETVCSCFHVPAYMIGIGTPPSFNNVEALNQQYYSQCLQTIIECIELLLDEGLGLDKVPGKTYGTEFDLDDLLRMDTATQYKTYGDGIKASLLAPNEGRKKIGLKPLPGGDTVYMQQQNFSLEDLNKRSQSDDPFAAGKTSPVSTKPVASPSDDTEDPSIDDAAKAQLAAWALRKAFVSLPKIVTR